VTTILRGICRLAKSWATLEGSRYSNSDSGFSRAERMGRILNILCTGSDLAERQLADHVEALAQRLLGVRPDQPGRQPGGIGGAEDCADRRAAMIVG
jgi:hypothetical protein